MRSHDTPAQALNRGARALESHDPLQVEEAIEGLKTVYIAPLVPGSRSGPAEYNEILEERCQEMVWGLEERLAILYRAGEEG